MARDDDVVKLLGSIDRRLALLTAREARQLRQALESEVLTTPARVKMFDAIELGRGGADIGRAAGVSPRAGQLFIKELLDLGLLRAVTDGDGRELGVERDDDAILDWYLHRRETA